MNSPDDYFGATPDSEPEDNFSPFTPLPEDTQTENDETGLALDNEVRTGVPVVITVDTRPNDWEPDPRSEEGKDKKRKRKKTDEAPDVKLHNVYNPVLMQVVDRMESLMDEMDALKADLKQVVKDAKSQGFDAATLKSLLKYRQDPSKWAEMVAMTTCYAEAVGMIVSIPEASAPPSTHGVNIPR